MDLWLIAAPLLLGVLSSAATMGEVKGAWYDRLRKPSWQPPSKAFGPVWTVLYVLMGLASWRAWRAGNGLGWYGVQLALNVVWSVIFFRFKAIRLALVDIVALWIAIVATIASFGASDSVAAWLMVPYLGWVTFAGVLNGTLVALNPRA